MSVMEFILQDLRTLSSRQLVDVARYVHRMNPNASIQREEILRKTHGYLSEEEGAAFEEAILGARKLDDNG